MKKMWKNIFLIIFCPLVSTFSEFFSSRLPHQHLFAFSYKPIVWQKRNSWPSPHWASDLRKFLYLAGGQVCSWVVSLCNVNRQIGLGKKLWSCLVGKCVGEKMHNDWCNIIKYNVGQFLIIYIKPSFTMCFRSHFLGSASCINQWINSIKIIKFDLKDKKKEGKKMI